MFAQFVKRIQRKILRLKVAFGFDVRLDTPDRRVLEDIILPHLAARTTVERILFAGAAWYTRSYRKYFSGKEYWTIDVDPFKKRYGAANHIVDSLEHLDRRVPEDYFDVIICNSVFGWGLDSRPAAEAAFTQCFKCLRPEGLFILGYDDVPEHRPYPPDQSPALDRFRPYVFPPLAAARYTTPTELKHTFNFYVR
jgi:SAM-dependent methyltransferase